MFRNPYNPRDPSCNPLLHAFTRRKERVPEVVLLLHLPPINILRGTGFGVLGQRRHLLSVLMAGLSYGARNVLSYIRCVMQNVLGFKDSFSIR